MNHPVDVHPEDLLDHELTRELTTDESARLDSHSARCGSCALMRAAKRDFELERASAPGDAQLIQRMSSIALGAAPSLVGIHGGPRSAFVLAPPRRLRAWAAAAVVLFAATGATASFWSVRHVIVARLFAQAPSRAPMAVVERIDPPAKPAIFPRVAIEAPAPQPKIVAAPPPRSKIVEEAAPTASAEQVFAAANEARRRGDSVLAAKLYRQLQQQFPGTREEVNSRYLLGRLLQDRGDDSSQSLALFTRYLAESPNGTLAEEARLGRALALMRLGRPQDERLAWQELLSSHPRSIHAERARKRLDELR